LRFGGRKAVSGKRGFWAGKTRIGESIAQRSRRSQRRIEVGWPKGFCGKLGFWAGKTRVGEEHRTEVTEGD
jgi:hypothetical protein